jgi:hypothetical protein
MNKDTKNIWDAYKLLTEISKKDMELVKYDRPVEDLPFDNIFGDKLRIVLPISLGESADSFFDSLIFNIEGAITLDKFKAKFPNILKFVRFNYNTKKAIVRIQTQMGEKDREETLASLVDKMYKCDAFPKEYRDKAIKWIEQNVSQLLPSSYVVISRSVIDNLRMSDISGIESCHSPGGGYYSSCLSEAAGGGVIAFVIDGGELKKKQIQNIETDEEIFSDKDRSVEGLEATYRLRMRKYYSSATDFFVLPETKVYRKSNDRGVGNSTRVPGLIEVLLDFLKTKQELNKEDILKLFTDKDITRKGGSYEDTADSYLFNQYFGGTDFKGSIPYEEEEMVDNEEIEEAQSERRYEQFEQELSHFLRNSGVREAKHVDSWFDVEVQDDYVYYNASGYITIDLDDIELIDYTGTDDELENLEQEELRDFASGKAKYAWLKPTDKKFRFYKELFGNFKKIGIDEDYIRIVKFIDNGYTIEMYAHLNDYNYDDGTMSSDVDNYPPFLRNLMEWDAKYDKIKLAIIRALSVSGYADLTENQKIQYGLADFDDSKREFDYVGQAKYTPKNLRYEGDWATFILQTGINPTHLYALDLNLQGSSSRNEIRTQVLRNIKDSLTIFVQEKMDENYDLYSSKYYQDSDQKKLKLENFDMDTTIYLMTKDRRHISFEIHLKNVTNNPTGDSLDESPTGLAFKVSFEVDDRNTLSIKAVDEGLNDVKNIITGCIIKYLVPEEKRTFQQKNIIKTYNTYINGTPQNPHQL